LINRTVSRTDFPNVAVGAKDLTDEILLAEAFPDGRLKADCGGVCGLEKGLTALIAAIADKLSGHGRSFQLPGLLSV